MKYLKTYEIYNAVYPAFSASLWNNISVKNDILTINVYQLANEMLNSIDENPDNRDEKEVEKMEKEYTDLVGKLLFQKVISFSCGNCLSHHKDVCDDITFEGGFQEPEKGFFYVDNISLKLLDDNWHNVDDEKIIVYLNEDPELYKATNKYNL